MELKFTWDPDKAALNQKRHGVSFVEAAEVFADPFRLEMVDLAHSESEGRFVSIGMTRRKGVLFIVYIERVENEIRIISARKVTAYERKIYEERK